MTKTFFHFATAEIESRRCTSSIPLPPPTSTVVQTNEETSDPYDVVCWILKDPVAESETQNAFNGRNLLKQKMDVLNQTFGTWMLSNSGSPRNMSEQKKKRRYTI